MATHRPHRWATPWGRAAAQVGAAAGEAAEGAGASAARYGTALLTVAVATALTWLIWVYIKPQVSPLFFAAVVVAAWRGGLGPALLATALCGFISIYVFSDPVFSVKVDAEDFLRVTVFVVVAVGVSALADARRKAEAKLRAAHGGLERRVAERTSELAALNDALKREVGERMSAESRLRDLAAEVVLAEQRERRRIAERLHDELGQLLALSQIRVGNLRAVADPAARAGEIEAVEDLIEEAVTRTRSITCELSPPVLHELGLLPALQWLAGQVGAQAGAAVTVRCAGDCGELSEEARITLFQIARELLANVAKHARARSVVVMLCRREDEVTVVVQDDGAGFDPRKLGSGAASNSFGLFSIRERLRHHGGTLHVLTEPGGGTQVSARLPVAGGRRGAAAGEAG